MCFRYWESGLNVLAQIKHKDRKCGVSEGRGVSYIVYGKGLTHKHIMLWLRPVALTFFLKERGKAAFNLNCSLLSTLWKCIRWVHGSTVIVSNVLIGWELKIKKEVEENVMHDAWCIASPFWGKKDVVNKNVSFKHSDCQHFPHSTLSVTTYPSHFKLPASHHNNLQRERERHLDFIVQIFLLGSDQSSSSRLDLFSTGSGMCVK